MFTGMDPILLLVLNMLMLTISFPRVYDWHENYPYKRTSDKNKESHQTVGFAHYLSEWGTSLALETKP